MTRSLVCLTLSAFVALAAISHDAQAASERRYLSNVNGSTLAASMNPQVTANVASLKRIATTAGKVNVIVGLRVPFAPEGELAATEVSRQRQDIQASAASLRTKMKQRGMRNLQSLKEFSFSPFASVELTADELEFLLQQNEVISIEPDRISQLQLAQSSPVVGAPAAWTSGYSGAGQVVAVLDTGVAKTHPFLTGKVVSEACYSGGGSTANSLCPGGVLASTAIGSGLPCSLGGCDHGTHVAGIVAGTSGSFSGVAKGAKLIAIKVFTRTSGGVGAYDQDLIRALERVYALRYTYKIASVNMSLGGGRNYSNCDSSPLKPIIDNLRSAGIATVIASGNDGFTNSMGYPACISSAVSVGATLDAAGAASAFCGSSGTVDKVACFSNSASFLRLLAPGADIYSSIPGSGYANKPGTSMAAPHVAGAWAVLKQKVPAASVTTVLNALIASGKPVTDYRNGIVKPRINVSAALTRLSTGPTVAFGASTYSVTEGTASVIIPVKRSSTTGTATVYYTTANGTAAAGSDYSTRSGTLSFAAGVGSLNITVPILNDATAESKETFTVRLSSPTGAALGTPSTTTVAITDNDGGSSVTPLQNGVAITNISGALGTNKYYSISVPAGATNFSISTYGGTGDVDMYARYGAMPTLSVYDCSPYLLGNDEGCSSPAPAAGTYYVMLNGAAAYAGVTLVASYTAGAAASGTTSAPASAPMTAYGNATRKN